MSLIRLTNVSLHYPIYSRNAQSARARLLSSLGGRVASHDKTTVIEALRDISLELKDGDRLGLIGHNGAGKTTMLRLMSGIYEQAKGDVVVEGKVSTFVDITLGMDPEATGWDNIILRGVFLGMTFKEAKARAPEIAAFSDLGEYLDFPTRTYSAGMFMRLAFAVTTSIQPDIMIMDEMIGAGDAAFFEKAMTRARSLLDKTKIVVMATHSPEIMKIFCTKGAWLEKGELKAIGSIDDITAQYLESVRAQQSAH